MNPNDFSFVEKLRNLIAEQIPILEVALAVHKSRVAAELLPLHERLEECFSKMQTQVEAKYGKRTTDLKFEREPSVILRKGVLASNMPVDNRLSETSMGSSE
jgi:dedicator of cytokinesis protein 1